MITMTIHDDKFRNRLKSLDMDLRRSARRILKELSTELVEESVRRVSEHSRTGHMKTTIHEYSETGWTRIVDFGESTYLDKGSDPHTMPIKDTIIMSRYYGMHPDHFANHIKKYGTKPHPFIDESFKKILGIREKIYRRELKRTM